MYTESFGATYLKAGKTYSIDIFDIEQTHRGNYMYRIGKVEDDASDNIDNALTIPIETEIQKSFIGKDDIDFLKFTIPPTVYNLLSDVINAASFFMFSVLLSS